MSEQTAAKVTGAHLARTAYLYVRQSTLRQVLTNTESATRQYALRQKAIAAKFAIRVHPRSVERALARAENSKSGDAQ